MCSLILMGVLARIFHQNNRPTSVGLKADLQIQCSFMRMPSNWWLTSVNKMPLPNPARFPKQKPGISPLFAFICVKSFLFDEIFRLENQHRAGAAGFVALPGAGNGGIFHF